MLNTPNHRVQFKNWRSRGGRKEDQKMTVIDCQAFSDSAKKKQFI